MLAGIIWNMKNGSQEIPLHYDRAADNPDIHIVELDE